jgi:outer membrane protein assembly factor BamB
MLANSDPADWLMWRRTLNSWGYSPLIQITRANVSRLRMVWIRGMGPGIQEATPLVHNGVMYLPNPSDLMQAMNAATGDLLWEYILPSMATTSSIPVRTISSSPLMATSGKLAWEERIQDYRELPGRKRRAPSPRAATSLPRADASPKPGPMPV